MSSFAEQIPEIPKGRGMQAYKDLAWFLWYSTRSSKKHAAILLLVFAMTPLLIWGAIYFTKNLVDAFTNHNQALAVWMFVALAITTLLRGIMEQLRQYVKEKLRLSLDLRIKQDVMLVLNRLDPAVLEHPSFQSFYHAFNEGRMNLLGVAQEGYYVIFSLLELLGTATIFLILPWWVTAVICFFIVPIIIAQSREQEFSWSVISSESREGRRVNYYKDVLTGSRWLTSRWVLGLHNLFYFKWQKLIVTAIERRYKQGDLRLRGQLLVSLMTFTGFILGAGSLARTALASGNIGALVVFLPAYGQFSGMIGGVVSNTSWIITQLPAVQMTRLLWEMPARQDGVKSLPRKALEIVFDNVSFSYPDQKKLILNSISTTFREGEYLALVGLNGAGKSTFLKLLAGIYRPTSGSIFVNGISLADVRSHDWQQALGYATQSVPDFDDTVREQIRYGDQKRKWSDRGELALYVSGFGDIAQSLPRGLDTHVGRGYGMPEDEPIDLSGGQRQLLMIAQTLYRRARIFIFDEPTSAVDAEKEEHFFSRLPEAVQGKLCIVVSHRFSVLRRAKRVLVMDAGRIIEDGSHDELVAKQGRYAELFALQAKMYQ